MILLALISLPLISLINIFIPTNKHIKEITIHNQPFVKKVNKAINPKNKKAITIPNKTTNKPNKKSLNKISPHFFLLDFISFMCYNINIKYKGANHIMNITNIFIHPVYYIIPIYLIATIILSSLAEKS